MLPRYMLSFKADRSRESLACYYTGTVGLTINTHRGGVIKQEFCEAKVATWIRSGLAFRISVEREGAMYDELISDEEP